MEEAELDLTRVGVLPRSIITKKRKKGLDCITRITSGCLPGLRSKSCCK